MQHHKIVFLLALSGGLLFSACSTPAQPAPTQTARPTRAGALTPFLSPTASTTPTPGDPSTATPQPSYTPTPLTHVVEKGEDMFGIALRYRISLDELKAANPTVQPNFLSIGTALVIPYSKTPMPTQASTTGPQTPTPLPLNLGQVNCLRAQDGGTWCFLSVSNPQANGLEGISAMIRLANRDAVVPVTAFLALDVLPAGATLPLVAYYPPKMLQALAEPYQASSELLTALPAVNNGRYLPAQVENADVQIDENGRSATVRLVVTLSIDQGTAQRVWVLAYAYDAQRNIIGVRRWENDSANTLVSGQSLPVEISVYSVSGKIERVELAVEARP